MWKRISIEESGLNLPAGTEVWGRIGRRGTVLLVVHNHQSPPLLPQYAGWWNYVVKGECSGCASSLVQAKEKAVAAWRNRDSVRAR